MAVPPEPPEEVTRLLILIIDEVGDTPDKRLLANLNTIWGRYVGLVPLDNRLPFLYAKRTFIDLALGYHRMQVDTTTGQRVVKRDQLTQHLADMRAQTQAEIVRVERSGGPAGGALTTVASVTPYLVDQPDDLDPVLTGSPYIRAYPPIP